MSIFVSELVVLWLIDCEFLIVCVLEECEGLFEVVSYLDCKMCELCVNVKMFGFDCFVVLVVISVIYEFFVLCKQYFGVDQSVIDGLVVLCCKLEVVLELVVLWV